MLVALGPQLQRAGALVTNGILLDERFSIFNSNRTLSHSISHLNFEFVSVGVNNQRSGADDKPQNAGCGYILCPILRMHWSDGGISRRRYVRRVLLAAASIWGAKIS